MNNGVRPLRDDAARIADCADADRELLSGALYDWWQLYGEALVSAVFRHRAHAQLDALLGECHRYVPLGAGKPYGGENGRRTHPVA